MGRNITLKQSTSQKQEEFGDTSCCEHLECKNSQTHYYGGKKQKKQRKNGLETYTVGL
jgi:hypothetical protein